MRRHEVLHGSAGARADDLGDAAAVAVADVALVAQQAHAPPAAHQRGQLVELLDRIVRGEMLLVDAEQRRQIAAARRLAALGRRAEPAQMQIGDAALVERGGKLAFGEAGPA